MGRKSLTPALAAVGCEPGRREDHRRTRQTIDRARSRALVTAMLPVMVIWPAFAKPIVYVDRQSPSGDGADWCNAYPNLQDALAAAYSRNAAVEIRIARGTYKPDAGTGLAPGERNATFRIPGGLTLLGGFAGCGAPDPDERHLSLYETVLSGDLMGDDAPGQSTCCFAGDGPGCDDEPCREAVCADQPQCCTAAWGDTCVAAARLRCCETCGNTCDNSFHVVTFDLLPNLPTHLDGLIIRGGNAEGGDGGGIVMPYEDRRPLVSRSLIENNVATHGGGAATRGGRGIRFENCVFRNNAAYDGGALYSVEPLSQLVNCLLVSNHAVRAGGALYWEDAYMDWEITNCTVVANSAAIGGGFYSLGRAYPDDREIRNNIMWGNRAFVAPQIALNQAYSETAPDSLTIANSIVEGGASAVLTSPDYALIWTTSASDADPQFSDPLGQDGQSGTADDDYRLAPGSPAIDAGNNGPIAGIVQDLAGGPRLLDDPGTADTGVGLAPIVDLGPYEFCFADRAGYALFVGCQHGPDTAAASACDSLDLDADGRVDLADFAEFQAEYCGTR